MSSAGNTERIRENSLVHGLCNTTTTIHKTVVSTFNSPAGSRRALACRHPKFSQMSPYPASHLDCQFDERHHGH